MRLLVIILALAFAMNDDGAKQGRKGNELYRNADHETASILFTTGITEQNSSERGAVHSGLWNNLGASLHRLGKFDEAREAFSNAVALAPSSNEVARSSYNAGNNAFESFQQSSQQSMGGGPGMPPGMPPSGAPQQGQAPQGQQQQGEGLEDSLEHYKQSMLADPTNEDAKFNYEYVKRMLEDQEQNQDQQQQEDQNNQDQQNNEDQENQEQQDQQQNQDQEQQDQQQQDQQQQDQQQQEQEQQEQQQNQEQQQPPPDPNKLSKEEAERILQALQNEEEELLREVMKSQARPKKVEKDW